MFVYKIGTGTYSGLDDPNTQITTTGSDTLSVLPAIPLRLNNVNFNASGQSTTKRDKIIGLANTVGLDAENIIAEVMADVAATNIANYQNKIDLLHDHEYDPDCEYCSSNQFVKEAEEAKTLIEESYRTLRAFEDDLKTIEQKRNAIDIVYITAELDEYKLKTREVKTNEA